MKLLSTLVEAAGFILIGLGLFHISPVVGLIGSGVLLVVYAALLEHATLPTWFVRKVNEYRIARASKADS